VFAAISAHRSQIPTNLFSGCKEPLVFIDIEILDDVTIREHSGFGLLKADIYRADIYVDIYIKDAGI
jgi:hypothetical protein